MLQIVFCICADDIERGRIRGDFGLTYDAASLRTFEDLEDFGFSISAVIVNRYHGEKGAKRFMDFVRSRGIAVYTQPEIPGYPADVEKIVSSEGYGANPFIETTKPLVIVTGAGPGSGKMSTCLSQVYHHHMRGQEAGFAKFETFPIWNLPLEHPVNIAYEAATADLQDKNQVDPFHLEAYRAVAVNYNRDIENFSIMHEIIGRIGASDSPRNAAQSAEESGKGHRGIFCGAAIELRSGDIVLGMNSPLLHAESAAVLHALKKLAGIPEQIDLLSEAIISSIALLKKDVLGGRGTSLNVEEVLIALSMSAATNPTSAYCMKVVKDLAGCDMHTTHIVGKGDENGLRKLRLNLTTDALPTSRGFYY